MYVAQYELALLIHKDQFRNSEKRNELDLYGGVVEPFQPRRNVFVLIKRRLNGLKPQPQEVNDVRPAPVL